MISRGKAEKRQARSRRLSAALRENLKRRRAQARGRAAGGSEDETRSADVSPSPSRSPDFRRNRGSD
jgi:hypothetical protein